MNAKLSSMANAFLRRIFVSSDTTSLDISELSNIRYKIGAPNATFRFIEKVVVVNKLRDILSLTPRLGVLYKIVFGKDYIYIGPKLIASRSRKVIFDFLDNRTLYVSPQFLSDDSIIIRYLRKAFASNLFTWSIKFTTSPKEINDYKSMNSISSFVINQVNRLNAD